MCYLDGFFVLESLKCLWNASDSYLGRVISQSSTLLSFSQFLKANSRVVCLKGSTISPSPSTSLPTHPIMTTFYLNRLCITYAISTALFSSNTLLTGGLGILPRSAIHISDLVIFSVTTVTTSTFTTKDGRHAPRIFQWIRARGLTLRQYIIYV